MFRHAPGSRLWQCKALRLGLVALLLFGTLAALVLTRYDTSGGQRAPLTHTVPVKPAGGCGCRDWCCSAIFIHTASPANSQSDYTKLDDASVAWLLTNNPNAMLIVTPNLIPGKDGSAVFDRHPIGVFHDTSAWYIFNQDFTPIPNGAAFNVFVALDASIHPSLVQTATSANSTSDYTCIDDPNLNGQPNMELFVTPNWNPGFAAGVYNNHPIGVFYNTSTGHWCIFNQDRTPILAGAAFNVIVVPPGSANPLATLQTATSTNSIANITILDDASLNGNPGAIFFVTPVWNPGGSLIGVYENHTIGLSYNTYSRQWWIVNEDSKPMPTGAAFFILDALGGELAPPLWGW